MYEAAVMLIGFVVGMLVVAILDCGFDVWDGRK